VLGLVQLADAAAITAGTATRVVDAAQLKAAVAAEDLWDRTGSEITPKTAGDSVFITGDVKVGGTTAAPIVNITGTHQTFGPTGTSANFHDSAVDPKFRVNEQVAVVVKGDHQYPATLVLAKDRVNAPVKVGDTIGAATFQGFNGSVYKEAVRIDARVEVLDTPTAGMVGGALSFATSTTNVHGSTLHEKMRLTNAGNLLIGGTLPSAPNITLGADGNITHKTGAGNAAYSFYLGNGSTSDSLFVGQDAAGKSRIGTVEATPLTFWTNTTERAQLTSTGDFILGGTLPASPNIMLKADGTIFTTGSYQFGSGNAALSWAAGSGASFATSTGSNITIVAGGLNGVFLGNHASAWSPATSESRLKDIQSDPDTDQCWSLIRDIELKRYYYKDQDDKSGVPYMGPMADWLGVQDPELLIDTGRTDEHGPIHTYNQGLLDMKALAALSAALKRIEALEAEVAALKAA
jgi:hypothetical protein